ncbi:MAG: DEAD/DEAH box helicase [Tannerella sp.]|jgi:hypothetical protein|nr:DEAD/DEAH box helicase [Tannerella sp.]
MDGLNDRYVIKGASISGLTYTDIFKHCRGVVDIDRRTQPDIQAEAIEIDSGVFFKPLSLTSFPRVFVYQSDHSLILTCSCDTPKTKLCEHEVEVLFSIIDRPEFRVFFDPDLRKKRIRAVAADYGMENETDLERYFEIGYINGSLSIKPTIRELVKVDTEAFKERLLPEKFVRTDAVTDQRMILVIGKHRYYESLHVELYEGKIAQSGKVKNPVTPIDAMDLIWKAKDVEVVKFLTAVSQFQHNYIFKKTASDFELLKMVVKNPLNLDVFYHDHTIAEKVAASSIVPVELDVLDANIKLSVFKKEPFFEITGEIVFQDTSCSFKDLNVKLDCFILKRNRLSLVADADMLRVIEFFKANNQILLIHSSKYEEFRQTILANLEHRIRINYSYIVPATQKQLIELHFDRTPERIIYLSDHESFVYITPVMKYGNVEIPVFSKKQIFDTDANGNVFKVERDDEQELEFVSVLLQQHADFKEQLHEPDRFYLHRNKFLDEDWFPDAFEEWQQNGITILGFNELKKNRLNANKAVVSVSVLSGIDWFNVGLEVRYGRQKASLRELSKSIRNRNKYVRLGDGTNGILPAEWIRKIAGFFQVGEIDEDLLKIPKSNFSEIRKLFEDEVLSKEVKREIFDYSDRFANVEKIPDIPVPATLNATLRDYQKVGLNWLNLLDDFNFGGCLADDMGLGKTLQIIAFILSQREKREHNTNLVVVPASLLFNWRAEVEQFAPSINVLTHHGAGRVKDVRSFDGYEIVLTTYGTLLSDIRFLKGYRFNYIFLDESQAIKNPESERYKAARLLQSRNKIVLTGTPIENNTYDIYGQLSFACPGLLGSKRYFKEIYSTLIDKFQDDKRALMLRQKIEPFVLRRTKEQVAKELPEKTEIVLYCEMGDVQRKVYDAYERELRDYLTGKDEQEIKDNSVHVLAGLTRLRQICDSPLLLREKQSSGGVSAKIEVLMEQIENKSPRHKILVFSQFVSMLDLIKDELVKRDISFEYLTGQVKDRGSVVNEFQQNEHVRVFLISLKAGGTGLNLTEADYVYLVDPWWNPAVENQAIDRCYRIGQKKNVFAVRLICPGTIEEKIMNLQRTKTRLADDLIKTDASVFGGLSKGDLIGMLEALN